MLNRIKSYISSNRPVQIALLILLGFIVLAIILTIITVPADNKKLSSNEKKIQHEMQSSAKDNKVRYTKTLASDGDYKLVEGNLTDQRENYSTFIFKGDTVILGPATDFTLEQLVENNVPDKIIDYLYPNQLQWVFLDDKFYSYFPYDAATVKYMIQRFGNERTNSQFKRAIVKKGSIKYDVTNARDTNRTESTTFTFTINSNQTEYIFTRHYRANEDTNNYQILDKDGNVLSDQTVNI